jgi:putative SOS response-associated peptidase YedK
MTISDERSDRNSPLRPRVVPSVPPLRSRLLYRLTIKLPPHNLPPRYNICPTDPVDLVTERDGSRDFLRMRWGLVPSW